MPERFGRYWLHEKIGHGGMAEIFRATIGPDPDTYAFDVALKRMHAHLESDQSQVDMFLTEADVAKFLHHPNLVRVYEAGLIEGRAFIGMESIWGHDLAKLIAQLRRRRLRFPSDLAIYIVLQLLRALDYVHRARSPGGVDMNLVHRDVTPSNVYVTFGGDVKLGDFGVAHISFLEPQKGEDAPLKGKAMYMPPEVLAGEPVSQEVDLWGASALLYEMLTARRVFEGVSEEDLISGVEPPAVMPAHRVNPDIDPRLSKIIGRALHANPKKRPRTAVELYRLLKLHLHDTGVVVDGSAVAAFVWELTGAGNSPLAPKPKADTSQFALPEYQVPIDGSPTQQFQAVRRRRQRVPLVVVGGVILAAAIVGFARWATTPDDPSTDPVVEGQGAEAAPEPELVEPTLDLGAGDSAPLDMVPEPDPATALADPTVRFKAAMHRGKIQFKRKRFDTALQAYDDALTLRPGSAAAHLGRANVLLALGRHDEAETAVNASLEKRPRHVNAYLLLGDIQSERGDVDQARWAYKRIIDIDPTSRAARQARQALGRLDAGP